MSFKNEDTFSLCQDNFDIEGNISFEGNNFNGQIKSPNQVNYIMELLILNRIKAKLQNLADVLKMKFLATKTKTFLCIKHYKKTCDFDFTLQLFQYKLRNLKILLTKNKTDKERVFLMKKFLTWRHKVTISDNLSLYYVQEEIRNSRFPSISTNDDLGKHLEDKIKEYKYQIFRLHMESKQKDQTIQTFLNDMGMLLQLHERKIDHISQDKN